MIVAPVTARIEQPERMHLRGQESEIEAVHEIGVIHELDGDRVRRAQVHGSHDDAIAAAEALHA